MPSLPRLSDPGAGAVLRCAAILALSLIAAAFAGREAALAYWRTHAEDRVPALLAADPAIRLRQTEAYLARPADLARQAPEIERRARAVLAATPLDAVAMRQLGVAALAERRDGEGKLRLAERISKRDAIGQVLLIELTAEDGSVAQVLPHYDRAIAVNPATKATLFPVLAAGLADPEIRKGLELYVGRPWFNVFLTQARAFGAAPEALFDLLAELQGRIPAATAQTIRRDLLWDAIRGGRTEVVRGLIARLPGHAAQDSGGFGFGAGGAAGDASLLAWVIHEDDQLSVSQVSGGLTVRIAPERSGLAAERMTLLAPGDYELSQVLAYDAIAPQARLAWTVECLDGGTARRLWARDLPAKAGQVAASLTIPPDCQLQHWQLAASADVSQLQSEIEISQLKLSQQ